MQIPALIPARQHFVAIGLLSFSMIAMQILVTRIFSVVFYYHFAFAGITLAMLGLTVGAFKVYYAPHKFTPSNINRQIAKNMAFTGIFLVIATLFMVDISGRFLELAKALEGNMAVYAENAGKTMLFLWGPFFLCAAFTNIGICITLLLTYFPLHTNRLYAVDLISASLACIIIVLALSFLDPVSIILLLAFLLAIIGWQLSARTLTDKKRMQLKTVLLVLGCLFLVQSYSYKIGEPIFHLRVGKLNLIKEFEFERWNSFTHVGVYKERTTKLFGAGFGSKLNEDDYKGIQQQKLVIDVDAATAITNFGGDLNKVGYLKYDVVNFAYNLRDINHTAIIGVGGGRDVLSALAFGVKNITGIEINPAIFEALNVVFADFSGKLSSFSGVNLVNAEARSYINSHAATYDMIQISLIDTWAATAAGGLALSENKLYTKEAWVEFLDHLNSGGMLSIVRWFVPKTHQGELYRLLSLAYSTLKAIDPKINVRDHVLVINSNDNITLIVSKSALTASELEKVERINQQYGFTSLVTPNKDFDDLSKTILSGNVSDDFYASLPLDLTPPTDDRPFFFNMTRFSGLFFPLSGQGYNLSNNIATYVLVTLSIIVFTYLTYAVIWPMLGLYRSNRVEFSGTKPFIAYFTLIGLGFMFIEMSLMQWLMIFLGHPVYGLCVILFTLLLFSGIGSYTVRYDRLSYKTYITRSLALCVLLLLTFFAAYYLRTHLAHYPTNIRILFSVLLLIPVSLCMGMMFPLGVAAAKKEHARLLPWFWALNGAASVFASIFAVVLSMSYGASFSYILGIICYVLCFLICLHIGKSTKNAG